jgi:hypothetical protein
MDWSWPQRGDWDVSPQGPTSEKANADPCHNWILTSGIAISQEEQQKTRPRC